MSDDDEYTFSVEDGCVVLEIFDDSDDDSNDSNDNEDESDDGVLHKNKTSASRTSAATAAIEGNQVDDCGTESLATNGYSSDTSSLTINSETLIPKSRVDSASRHSSSEQVLRVDLNTPTVRVRDENNTELADRIMGRTENLFDDEPDDELCDELDDQLGDEFGDQLGEIGEQLDDQLNVDRDNVICIQPQANLDALDSLNEDSAEEFEHGDFCDPRKPNNDMHDVHGVRNGRNVDAFGNKQALSLNELFKQYRKDSAQSSISNGPQIPTANKELSAKHLFNNQYSSCPDDFQSSNVCNKNYTNSRIDALRPGEGVTEYLIRPMSDRPKDMSMKTVHAERVSSQKSRQMPVAVENYEDESYNRVIKIKQELYDNQDAQNVGFSKGEIYDRKRPNLRRLRRVNMAEDEYFNSKLQVIDKPLTKSKYKKAKGFVTPRVSQEVAVKSGPSVKKAKRQPAWNERVQCDVCEGWFASTQSLGTHMRIHNNEKPYGCPVCGWKSRTSSAHSLHLKLHSKNKQFKCSVCNMKFYTSSMLKSHFRVHSGERPYQCPYCPDSFAHGSTLKVHIRQHTNERPYACTICNKRFAQPTHLTTHLRMHSDEKPFECKYCGKRMRQSSHLKIHLRIHTQERPYNCDQCTANFMTKEHLVMHKRTHTGDHPYLCRVCGAAFTQSSARKKHERRHEEGVQYRCDICSVDFISPRSLQRHKKIHEGGEIKPVNKVKRRANHKAKMKVKPLKVKVVPVKVKVEPPASPPPPRVQPEIVYDSHPDIMSDQEILDLQSSQNLQLELDHNSEEELPALNMSNQMTTDDDTGYMDFSAVQQDVNIKQEPHTSTFDDKSAIPKSIKRRRRNPLQCEICFKTFARIPNVTRHKMEIHAGFKRSTWAHTFVRKNFEKVKKHLDFNYYQ